MKIKIPSLRIRKADLIFVLVMCSFMEPALLMEFNITDAIYLVFKIISALYVLYYMIYVNHGLDSLQVGIVLFFGSLVVTTALNHGDVFHAIRTVTFNMLACLYLDAMIQKDSNNVISILRNICVCYVVVNAVLLILFPGGFGKYIPGYSMTVDSRLNFLGKDNAFIHFFIFALVTEFLYSRKKSDTYFMIAVMISTMLYVWSGTGVVVCLLITLFALVFQGKRIERFFNWASLSLTYVGIYCAIAVFRLQDLFSGFIVDVLHKDITFTGRTDLWDMAMLYISRKPYTGYGITAKFLTMKSGISYSPHNLILQILLAGGVVSLAAFIMMYVVTVKKLKPWKYKYSCLLAFSIFCYLIASLTESTMNTQYLYFIFVFAYNISLIENNKSIYSGSVAEEEKH